MTSRSRAAIGVAAAAALAGAVLVPVGAAGAVSPPAGDTAATRTAVRFVVTGCDGCTIGAQRAVDPGSLVRPAKPSFWNGPKAIVRNGVAVLVVPTAYTQGMSFWLRAPWEGGTGAVTNIVLGSKGHPEGTRVTAAQAKKVTRATACWVGTTAARVRIPVQVTRITVQGTPDLATAALAWANPTVGAIGVWGKAYHGWIANQEAWYC